MAMRGNDAHHETGGRFHCTMSRAAFLGLFLIIFAPGALVLVGTFLAGLPDAVEHALPLLGACLVAFSVLAACAVRTP